MDVFMPFIQRTPGTPIEQDPKTVVPVFKEARLEPLRRHEQKFLILRRFGQRQNETKDYPEAPYTTPEEEQRVDKNGHVDIFI